MKNWKKICLFVLFLAVLVVGFYPTKAQADIIPEEDPQYAREHGVILEGFYGEDSSPYAISPIANGTNSNATLRKGIDVSQWQGDIDWAKAKAAGVEFAIIRVAYRGTSAAGPLSEDRSFAENIERALANDIKVGVYIFSQAITEKEAEEEANYVISRIYQYNITLPIVIDYEYDGNGTGRLYTADLSVEKATSICNAFCKTVQNAGYTGMVYANKYMLEEKLNASEISKNYRIWLAHWVDQTDYQGDFTFWQYSGEGNGRGAEYGVSSENLDLDYWYDDGTIFGKDYSIVIPVI